MEHITHTKGDIAEAAVVFNLTYRGYDVFKPLTQNTFADIVIFRNNKFESIQVKYLTPKDNKIVVRCQRRCCNMTTLHNTYNYSDTILDWIAAYIPDNRIAYLPRPVWEGRHEITVYLNDNSNGAVKFNNFTDI